MQKAAGSSVNCKKSKDTICTERKRLKECGKERREEREEREERERREIKGKGGRSQCDNMTPSHFLNRKVRELIILSDISVLI